MYNREEVKNALQIRTMPGNITQFESDVLNPCLKNLRVLSRDLELAGIWAIVDESPAFEPIHDGAGQRIWSIVDIGIAEIKDKPRLWVERFRAMHSSLYLLQDGVTWWVRGDKSGIRLGFQTSGYSTDDLLNMAKGTLLGAEITTMDSPPTEEKNHLFSIVGYPSLNIEQSNVLPLDKFMDTFKGEEWQYKVVMIPVKKDVILAKYLAKANAELDLVRRVNSLSVQMPIGRGALMGHVGLQMLSSTGELCAHQLESLRSLLENGLSTGLWLASVTFSSNKHEVAEQGAGILTSVMSGKDSIPTKVRAVPREQVRGDPSKGLTMIGADQAVGYFHLPTMEVPGFSVVPHSRFGYNLIREATTQPGMNLGKILFHGRPVDADFKLPLTEIPRHVFITGITGSGKTNTTKHLLTSAWESQIPFLVIEPAKSEYQNLLSHPDLKDQLLMMNAGGMGEGFPFEINPFEIMPGVPINTHIDYLRSVFQASFSLVAPMPYILDLALSRVYTDLGWDLQTGEFKVKPKKRFPSLKLLEDAVEAVVGDAGYTERISGDIIAALKARIRSLGSGSKGLIFNVERMFPPIELLMGMPSVLELHKIGDDEQKAFLIGLVLIQIYEYLEFVKRPEKTNRPTHITVVEEAHRLLTRTGPVSESSEVASPKAKAVEFFTNMLAEVRSYGESFVIADQIPSKLAQEVIKNTGTKIVHRMVARDDREIMAGAMNLEPDQERHLALLRARKGECVVFCESTDRAVMISVPLVEEEDIKEVDANKVMKGRADLLKRFHRMEATMDRQKALDGFKEKIYAGKADPWFKRILELLDK